MKMFSIVIFFKPLSNLQTLLVNYYKRGQSLGKKSLLVELKKKKNLLSAICLWERIVESSHQWIIVQFTIFLSKQFELQFLDFILYQKYTVLLFKRILWIFLFKRKKGSRINYSRTQIPIFKFVYKIFKIF